jgi:tetratricopeptide (TPR) repeat protein
MVIQFNTSAFADDFIELLSKATNAYKSGNYSAALIYYNKITEQHPENTEVYSILGTIYLEQYEDYNKAIENFSKAIKYDSTQASNYAFRGVARMKIGYIDGATSDLTRAITINNQNKTPDSFTYCTRALLYSMNSKYELAIKDATEAIKLQPKYPEAFHYRGLAKLNYYAQQKSITGIKTAIIDLNYAKEQYLQLNDIEGYQDVMRSYQMANQMLTLLNKELSK